MPGTAAPCLVGSIASSGWSGASGWVTVAIFVGVYVLVATERVHRVAAALGGAALVLGFGIVDSDEAFYSRETGIDWDVIFLLLGMMLVVGILRRTGAFEYLAIHSAKLARGRPSTLLVILVLVTAAASALLDNVTTVLLMAPVTLAVCRRLGIPPSRSCWLRRSPRTSVVQPPSSATRRTSSSPAGRT